MTTIKKINKQNRTAQPADVEKLMAHVKALQDAKYLLVDRDHCTAQFKLSVFNDRDQAFKNGWCNNILTYWCITAGLPDREKFVLKLYDLEQLGTKIGTYSLRSGFVAAD